MPYKHIEYKIPTKYDRRIKLEDYEREIIKELYGKISQRKLAKMFNVSRRLITFIGDPDQHKQNLLKRKEKGGSSEYYKKDKNTSYMKKHRRYKQELYKQGVLVKDKEK